MITFEYEEETKRWIANYKIGILICKVIGTFSLFKSFKENEKEEHRK